MKRGLWLLVALVLFVPISFSWAGSISISSTTHTDFKENRLALSMEIANRGDESAHDVQVTAEALGQTFASDVQEELTVNGTFNPVLHADLTPEKPGTYPVIVTVHYKDANQYPFSALTLTTFIHSAASIPKLHPVVKNIQLADEEVIEAKIKNLDDQPKTAQTRFVLPKELSSPDLKQEIAFGPNVEQTLSFRIKNFSALSGSHYPAYILLEYESDDSHFTSIASGQVEIVKPRGFVDENQSLLVGLGLFLIIVLIFLNRGKKQR